jgi:hypothetical protein
MHRKRKDPPDAALAPVPSEILDQFVREGPISPEELEAAVHRFKEGDHRARPGRRVTTPSRVSTRRREA